MSGAPSRLSAAVGFALLEHVRNRFALVLVLFYIPLWLTLEHWFVTSDPAAFLLRATGQRLTVNGGRLTMVSGAVNTVTLIVGFMMFMTTFKSLDFDRRLVLAGYPRLHLLVAKVAAMTLAAVLIAGYATAVVCFYWDPVRPALLAVGLFAAAVAYGGIGILLGSFLRSELAGMFVIIMVSLLDTMLQNPISNPAASKDGVYLLPEYGPTQVSVAAGFTRSVPYAQLLLGPVWFAGAWLLAMAAFRLRTRDHRRLVAA
ncbi:ABC transporter permease [Streptomyces sp. UNOC14_S4]|uniref:ABC transporter permease n=1 Tax=Streptomyces sp. UNOC14_S4 TaxID=2872340 RepID=UPI001E30BEE8|nr:ABC transporter permease [Streptomyces sp. UNOC14_S4]MCC3767767.1 ABC transporter permease [Streptomyces sp. UNOC14_S4]